MKKGIIIIGVIVFIIIAGLLYNYLIIKDVEIKLISDETISLNVGDLWKDPGYVVNNDKYQDSVIVNSDLALNKVGSYEIEYSLKVGLFSKKTTRTINVLKEDAKSDIVLKVNGENPYYLMNNNEYVEQGVIATDKSGGSLINRLVTTGSVDNKTDGNYEIVYEVTSNSGITKKITRNVVVYSFNFSSAIKNPDYSLDNEIIIDITDSQYTYTILPNEEKETSRNITYKVEDNGLYSFIFYDKNNSTFKYEVNITNIDKEEPSGTCTLSLNDTGATISVDAYDNGEISGYEYVYGSNKTSKQIEPSYTINTLDEKADVIVYDKAGNSKTITCNTVDNSTKRSRSYKLLTYTYKNKEYKYWFLEPANSKRNKMPLVVYFHGDGGRPNPDGVNKYGLPKYVYAGKEYPFYMIAPYCSNQIDFSHESYMEFVISLIDYITKNYNVDVNRIVISGGSSGARGAYAIAATYKNTFSSLVIISGITYQLYTDREKNLTYLPIWVFHGRNDAAVNYNDVKRHVENINSYGGNAKLTTYEGGHDSTDVAFETPEVIDWMISQRRKG